MDSQEEIIVPVQSYYKWQMAYAYGIDIKTFCTWLLPFMVELNKIGYKDHCKILSPVIVKLIFEKLGSPHIMPKRKKI